jgi:hypothetical protein
MIRLFDYPLFPVFDCCSLHFIQLLPFLLTQEFSVAISKYVLSKLIYHSNFFYFFSLL